MHCFGLALHCVFPFIVNNRCNFTLVSYSTHQCWHAYHSISHYVKKCQSNISCIVYFRLPQCNWNSLLLQCQFTFHKCEPFIVAYLNVFVVVLSDILCVLVKTLTAGQFHVCCSTVCREYYIHMLFLSDMVFKVASWYQNVK